MNDKQNEKSKQKGGFLQGLPIPIAQPINTGDCCGTSSNTGGCCGGSNSGGCCGESSSGTKVGTDSSCCG